MNIEYIRQPQGSYMRLRLEKSISQTEKEMLSNNAMEGILAVGWQQENRDVILRYDITGKQALDDLLEEKRADEKIWMNLLLGICKAARELEKYLLSQEGILLQPNMIFYDCKTEEVWFCYCPDERNFRDELLRLLEYLLTKTEHKNKEAVELAYGIYEEWLRPEYTLLDMMEYLQKHRMQKMPIELKEEKVFEEITVQGSLEKSVPKGKIPKNMKNWNLEGIYKNWKEQWKEKMTAWIQPFQKKCIKKKAKPEQILFEPEEEEVKQGLPTELLAEKPEEMNGTFIYEGTQGLTNIVITKLPFLIGSGEGCDVIIKAAGISRQHAKVTRQEEIYFLEDLNSTNGTRVEGELLSYKTKVSLKKNTLVHFANQPYRFQ